MARKNYQVKAKDGACWQKIHHSLCCTTHSQLNIPDRECFCKNDCKFDETIGTYQLSLAEVEELRKHSDILYVELDPTYHEHEMGPKGDSLKDYLILYVNRFGKNVKNYRDLHYVTDTPQLVQSSLMTITGQLGQGTTNWVKVKDVHPNTDAMNYWQNVGFPLIYDYAVYPSAPANANDPDPLRNSTQTGSNLITIPSTGAYQLFVAADGEYASIEWTRDDGNKIPDLNGPKIRNLGGSSPVTGIPAGKEGIYSGWNARNDNTLGANKEIRDSTLYGGIKYQVINLGLLKAGTHTITYEIRNGSYGNASQESWNKNPGGIAWQLYSMAGYTADFADGTGYITGNSSFRAENVNYLIPNGWNSSEANRTGYQLLRCEEGATNPWITSTRTVKNQDVQYTNDGLDVDLVIQDNGVWAAHPEFCIGENDPQNFITGNVLNRSAKSGVLDLALDAPAYLDPEFFAANPSLLETRWDGTRVPTNNAARNWWKNNNTTSRSARFASGGADDFGSIEFQSGYTRNAVTGTKTSIPSHTQSNGAVIDGDHGTPCASQAYGKNFGWAFNANKWTINMFADSMPTDVVFRITQLFHKYKPNNPKFNTKNPTVSSNSWGQGLAPSSVWAAGEYDYTYRGTTGTVPGHPGLPGGICQRSDWPQFVWQGSGPQGVTYPSYSVPQFALNPPAYWPPDSNGYIGIYWGVGHNALKAAISEGVIFAFAAGNEGYYLVDSDSVDYNNKLDSDIWLHRGAYPTQAKYESGYDLFVVGAIDNELKSKWTLTADTCYKDKGTGTISKYSDNVETLARKASGAKVNSGYDGRFMNAKVGNVERMVDDEDYSNKGDFIDFYAPADQTLGASIDINTSSKYNPWNGDNSYIRNETVTGSLRFCDTAFGGTSSACPVTAGLMACALQQNRGWSCTQLKTYLKQQISPETSSTFYLGYEPGSNPDSLKWASDYSTFETDVRIIRETSSSKTTPNPVYEATSGLAPSRPNLNERFSVTSGSAKVKIIGIREFTGSDAGNPIELRIGNGYYLMQITTDTAYSYGTFANTTIGNYKFKIKAGSNDQAIQVSDNNGSSWTALEISTVNGNFVIGSQGEVYYYLNVDNSVGLPEQPSNPTYVINLSPSTSVNEGGTLITTITTTDVDSGTTLYWRLDGTGINSSDFSSGSLTGSGSVNSQGSFQFSHTLANDLTTEGTQTLNVKLFTDSSRQIQVASTSIQINDTSISASYAISPTKTTPNEGETFSYGIGTSGVANGTTLYWEITGSVMSSTDFTPSSLTGSVTINNNSAAVTKTIREDLVTEGNERINFKLYTDSGRTNEVASNNSVVIQDTSTTPTTPTYTITPSNTTLNEGDTLTTSVTTQNVSNGTTLYWLIDQHTGAINTSDFSNGMSGSVSINNGSASFTNTIVADNSTEGEEKFAIKLYTDSGHTNNVANTSTITITDTSQSKTYNLSASSTTINEGSTVTTTVTTTNVSSGTTLYWELSGTGITSSDFSSGSLTGSGTVNAQGTFNFSHTLDNDVTVEGSETIAVRLYTDSGRTSQVGNTLSIIVNDTSIPQATYSISSNPTSVNEGSSFTTTVTTTNVANGTTLYWGLEGTNIDGNDFSTGALTGSGSISNNTFNFTHTLASDATTEGTETLEVALYVDSARTVKVAEVSVTINDTSQTPSTPTYVISPSKTSINEGETLTTTVTTSNVADGTTLYWQLDQHTGSVSAADFSSGAWNGAGTTSSSQFTFQHTVAADTTTEGEEKFAIVLATDAGFSNIVATSAVITINDTSTDSATPTYSLSSNLDPVNEGQFLAITVTTTNVASNTTLYWQFSGTNITAADFNEGTLESNIVTDATGSKAFGTTLRNDITTEGSETLLVKLFTDSARTTQVGNTLSITINDTSTSQAPTYSISPSVTQLNEGQSFTSTVTTTNVNDGVTLYWIIDEHTGTINAGDFSSGAIEGSGSISSGGFAFSHTVAEDATTEGTEKIAIKLYTDSGYTNNVANTSIITIFDTSTTSNPVYVLSTPSSVIREGDTFTTTVTTTNVVDSTDLWWKLEGINSSDLTSGSIEGQGTIISNTFSFSHALAKDMAQEGSEIIQIKLYSDSARNNQVGNTLGVTVKDTSQPGFNVDVTAPNNNEYILIGNDTDGTI